MSASGQSTRKKTEVQGYHHFLSGIQQVLEQARHQAARSVNATWTAAYWDLGRRIVEYE